MPGYLQVYSRRNIVSHGIWQLEALYFPTLWKAFCRTSQTCKVFFVIDFPARALSLESFSFGSGHSLSLQIPSLPSPVDSFRLSDIAVGMPLAISDCLTLTVHDILLGISILHLQAAPAPFGLIMASEYMTDIGMRSFRADRSCQSLHSD